MLEPPRRCPAAARRAGPQSPPVTFAQPTAIRCATSAQRQRDDGEIAARARRRRTGNSRPRGDDGAPGAAPASDAGDEGVAAAERRPDRHAIGAEPEEGGVAEAQDAGLSPEEVEAEGSMPKISASRRTPSCRRRSRGDRRRRAGRQARAAEAHQQPVAARAAASSAVAPCRHQAARPEAHQRRWPATSTSACETWRDLVVEQRLQPADEGAAGDDAGDAAGAADDDHEEGAARGS